MKNVDFIIIINFLFYFLHFVQKKYNKLYKNYKGVINMLAVSFSTMRNNLKSYCDKAVKENEDVIVTRKNEENVVLINLEKYNQFLKAVQNAEYLAKIDSFLR